MILLSKRYAEFFCQGTGNLTVRLLERVRNVIAVELDPRMVAE